MSFQEYVGGEPLFGFGTIVGVAAPTSKPDSRVFRFLEDSTKYARR